MKEKQIIKTITIEIAGVEVEVTPQQAKDLHGALGDLLGLNKPQQVIEKQVIRDNFHPYWPYRQLIWFDGLNGTGSPNSDRLRVTYSDATNNARLSIS